jgi:molybdate transport system substrate-binding protein
MRIRILAAVAFALAASAGWAGAAEINVFSTIGVQAALEELTPKFEQASGHKLVVTWNTAAVLVKRVQAGESAVFKARGLTPVAPGAPPKAS